jgi:hypothetical protein
MRRPASPITLTIWTTHALIVSNKGDNDMNITFDNIDHMAVEKALGEAGLPVTNTQGILDDVAAAFRQQLAEEIDYMVNERENV